MVKIVIENLAKKTLLVNDITLPVLRHLQEGAVDWMHACGGKGRCTTCKMIVVAGMNHFNELTPAETIYRAKGLLALNERLACQARISGDIAVCVSDEFKLPHLEYSF